MKNMKYAVYFILVEIILVLKGLFLFIFEEIILVLKAMFVNIFMPKVLKGLLLDLSM